MDQGKINLLIEQLTQDHRKGLLTGEQLRSLVFRLDRVSFSQSHRKDEA